MGFLSISILAFLVHFSFDELFFFLSDIRVHYTGDKSMFKTGNVCH